MSYAPPPINDSPPPSYIDELKRDVKRFARGVLVQRLQQARERQSGIAWVYARELDNRNATIERLAQYFRGKPKGGNG